MEKERGMDVKFVNPEDGFVVKTTRQSDGLKAFVNICQNQHIGKASFEESEIEQDGKRKRGQQWSIPFSLSQPRDDLDNAGQKCVVFDAVFNPETYKKGQQDHRFKDLIIQTALDGVEKQLGVKLNKKNLKFPKLKFKGMKQATVIRTKSKHQPEKMADNAFAGKTFPYPYTNEPTPNTSKKSKKSKRHKKKKGKNNNLPHYYRQNSSGNSSGNENCSDSENGIKEKSRAKHPNEPAYRIVHRGVIELQNFTNARDCCPSTRPKELVISIELPMLKSTGSVELDIFEKQLLLSHQNPPYHLNLALPFPIDEANGHAKFDKSKRELVVTLPVLPPIPLPHPHTGKEIDPEPSNEASADDKESKTPNGDTSVVNGKQIDRVMKTQEECDIEKDDCENKEVLSNSHLDDDDDDDDDENDGDDREDKHADFLASNGDFVNADDVIDSTDIAWDHGDLDLPTSPKEHDLHFDLPSNLPDMPSQFFFKAPPYSYHQDHDVITFIIHVPNVSMENVSLGFNENKCYINFPAETTKPHQLPPPDYALYITFNEGQNLAADLCHIDVTTSNVVLMLAKDEACKGLWDSFKAGPGEELLEEKFFITDKNIEVMMKEIADQDPWAKQVEFNNDLKIKSASKEHLTVGMDTKVAEVLNENVVNTTHVAANNNQVNRHKDAESNKDTAMDSTLFKNLDIGEGLLSNKVRHMKLSSPDEGIDCDFFRHERREKYSLGMSEKIAASTDPKLVQDHGHKTNLDERRKSRSDSVDSTSSDRSDGDLTITGAKSQRKSCMRRSSSTSTDDSSLGDDFDLNGPLSPNSTGWGSPGKKNVRFNLNPNVRVFSNKKDKQRRKMEQRLKNQKLAAAGNGEDKSSNRKDKRLNAETIAEEAHPGESTPENGDSSEANNGTQDDKSSNDQSSVDDGWTLVEKPPAEPALANSLIFELDD